MRMPAGTRIERAMLTPMYHGRIDRPVEYGILATFGLAFTLQYFVQAVAGASPIAACFVAMLSWKWRFTLSSISTRKTRRAHEDNAGGWSLCR